MPLNIPLPLPTLTKPPIFLLNSISVQEQKSAVIPSSSSREQWCLLRAELAVSNHSYRHGGDIKDASVGSSFPYSLHHCVRASSPATGLEE